MFSGPVPTRQHNPDLGRSADEPRSVLLVAQFASFLDHAGFTGLREALSVALRRPTVVSVHRSYHHLRSAFDLDAVDAYGRV